MIFNSPKLTQKHTTNSYKLSLPNTSNNSNSHTKNFNKSKTKLTLLKLLYKPMKNNFIKRTPNLLNSTNKKYLLKIQPKPISTPSSNCNYRSPIYNSKRSTSPKTLWIKKYPYKTKNHYNGHTKSSRFKMIFKSLLINSNYKNNPLSNNTKSNNKKKHNKSIH